MLLILVLLCKRRQSHMQRNIFSKHRDENISVEQPLSIYTEPKRKISCLQQPVPMGLTPSFIHPTVQGDSS